MNTNKQVGLGNVLKAAALGIISTLIFGAAFRVGFQGDKPSAR